MLHLPAGESDFRQRAEGHPLPEADEGSEGLLQEFNFTDGNVGCFSPWWDLLLKSVSQLKGKGCSGWALGMQQLLSAQLHPALPAP